MFKGAMFNGKKFLFCFVLKFNGAHIRLGRCVHASGHHKSQAGMEAAGSMSQSALEELVLELHRVGAVKFGSANTAHKPDSTSLFLHHLVCLSIVVALKS